MAINLLARVDALSPRNLTIREATRLAQNPNDLRWRAIFPRNPVDSIRLRDITTVDFRPVGGRREFNAQGREIPEMIGAMRDATIVPINPTHHIDEERMAILRESGIAELVSRGVISDVNRWAQKLADAADRQIERDAFLAWANGAITVKDPKGGQDATQTVSLGFSSSRYVTEGTAWASVANAYTRLLFHVGEAVRLIGSIGVIRMRLATAQEVATDAPTGPNQIRATIGNVQDRLSEEGFGPVKIVIDERTYDEFTDGGSATTSTAYIPTGKVLFQPASGVVGATHFAPVTRAEDYMGGAGIRREQLQDFTVFYREKNDGKTLMVESQANALSLPAEQNVYVVNAIT